jgi:acetyl esterase/lipase
MSTVPSTIPISWQSRLVHLLVRARMRPYADGPIDPSWVRRAMGRPRLARRWMARSTGAAIERRAAGEGWPGGEVVSWPGCAPDAPVLLYLHGGGYIACSPETHRPLVASLACRIRGRAFVPRYRLAPEYPFPAALDDAMAAYRYLLDVERLAPAQIVIAGDSAGGGLALALALAIRDAAWPSPAGLVTFCPWTDLAATGESLDENTEPMLPSISPLYGDFRGLPPMLVHASEDEVLRDDAIRVAEAARRAGVDVELQLWPHVPHVWQFFAAVLPEARASLAAATRFIRARTTHD